MIVIIYTTTYFLIHLTLSVSKQKPTRSFTGEHSYFTKFNEDWEKFHRNWDLHRIQPFHRLEKYSIPAPQAPTESRMVDLE